MKYYSVILDENELRMFDEISEEQQDVPAPVPSKKKKLLKGAAIGGAGLIGGGAGLIGGTLASSKLAERAVGKEILKHGLTLSNGNKYSANEMARFAKHSPVDFNTIKNAEAVKKYGNRIGAGALAGIAAGTLAAGYGTYKYLKHRDKKKNNN